MLEIRIEIKKKVVSCTRGSFAHTLAVYPQQIVTNFAHRSRLQDYRSYYYVILIYIKKIFDNISKHFQVFK